MRQKVERALSLLQVVADGIPDLDDTDTELDDVRLLKEVRIPALRLELTTLLASFVDAENMSVDGTKTGPPGSMHQEEPNECRKKRSQQKVI